MYPHCNLNPFKSKVPREDIFERIVKMRHNDIQDKLRKIFNESESGLEFEEKANNFFRDFYCRELGYFFEWLDSQYLNDCLNQGNRVERRDERSIQTLLGTVTYKRRLYRDRRKKMHYHLDEILDFEKGKRYSPLVVKLVSQVATKATYRQTEFILAKLTPITVSATGIREMVLHVSEDLKKHGEYQEYGLIENKNRIVPVLFVEGDAVAIKQQDASLRYLHRFQIHEGYQGFGKVRHCRNLKEFTNFSRDKAYQEIFSYLRTEYKLEESIVLANSDGGPGYQASIFEELCLGAKRVEFFLDKYHANRKILDNASDRELARKLIKAVINYNWDRVKAIEDTLESNLVLDEENNAVELEKLQRLKRYLKRNWKYLKPWSLRDLSMPRGGLGTVESHHRPYSYRMKKQGRSWGKKGEEAMVSIITAQQNHIYDKLQSKNWAKEIENLDKKAPATGDKYDKISVNNGTEAIKQANIPNNGPASSNLGRFKKELLGKN